MSYFLQIKNVYLSESLLNIIQPVLTITIQPNDSKIKINLLKYFISTPEYPSPFQKHQALQQTESLVQILINSRLEIIKFQLEYQVSPQEQQKDVLKNQLKHVLKKQFYGELFKFEIQKNMIKGQSLQKYILFKNIKNDDKSTLLNNNKEVQKYQIQKKNQHEIENFQIRNFQCFKNSKLLIKISYNSLMKYLGNAQILRSFEQTDQNIERLMWDQHKNINNNCQQKIIQIDEKNKIQEVKSLGEIKNKIIEQNQICINNLLNETKVKQKSIKNEKQKDNKQLQKDNKKQEQDNKEKEQDKQEQEEDNKQQEQNNKEQEQGNKQQEQNNKKKSQNNEKFNQIMLQTNNKQTNSIHLIQQEWKQYSNAQKIRQLQSKVKSQIDNKFQRPQSLKPSIDKQKGETPQSQIQQILQNNKPKKKKIFHHENQLSFNHIKIDKSSAIYKQLNGMYKFCWNAESDSKLQKVLNEDSLIYENPHHQ